MIAKNNDTIVFAPTGGPYKFHFYNLNSEKFISKVGNSIGKDAVPSKPPLSRGTDGSLLAQWYMHDTIFYLTPQKLIPYRIIEFEDGYTIKEKRAVIASGPFGKPEILISIGKMWDVGNYTENNN